MVNHVRSLLLNGVGLPGEPGEVYVPKSFKPRDLPQPLLEVRARLFGTSPDREMLNYRLQQFMTLLHATDASSFVTAKDPRLTYDKVIDRTFFPSDRFGVQATTHGTNGSIDVVGEPIEPDALGRICQRYAIKIEFGNISITQTDTHVVLLSRSYTGPKFAVLLDQTGYTLQIGADSVTQLTAEVVVRSRPLWDVGQIVAALAVSGEENLAYLFGDTQTEPYRTFSNLFFRHTENAYRLAGILLALAYRTEELGESRGG